MVILYIACGFVGAAMGAGLGFWLGWRFHAQHHAQQEATQHTFAAELLRQKETETAAMQKQLQDTFDALALSALGKSTEQFLHLAKEQLGQQTQAGNQQLDGKKTLIDQTLVQMKAELTKVQELVQTVEKDRQAKFDVLADQLGKTAVETRRLSDTTHTLQAALANSAVRGQWGERMAEDVLRLAGFVEGINYHKQQTLLSTEGKPRPDYTFYLPQSRVVHMDVKFPLENYMLFLEAKSDGDKDRALKTFLSDARKRVKEAATRGYADGVNTLNYV
ncbi:MAG: DNA recombination protein RmuC, partial [Alphaproteobacteria bacterium]